MRPLFAALAVATTVLVSPAAAQTAWDDIAQSLYDTRPIVDDGIVTLDAPYRAADPALVPITIRLLLPDGDTRQVTAVTLVIDENPAPVAATFTFGPSAGVSEISTRVRVNAYTPVRAVAELSDGSLHMAEKFVKASGGCAAPMAKDPAAALAEMGRMRLRRFAEPQSAGPMTPISAQLMIRHPNNSGLQMDQLTRLYIPAHFVRNVTIRQGDELIMTMEGGISLSEDPNFRFDYLPNGEPMVVEVTDTEGNAFTETWPSDGS